MSVLFKDVFAQAPVAGTASQSNQDRPKAKIWLNIGYTASAPTDEDPNNTVFISMPVGIPLDTQEPLPIRGANKGFLELRSAQNDLLSMLKEAAQQIPAGESRILSLSVEMRRVKDEPVAVATDANPLSMRVPLIAG